MWIKYEYLTNPQTLSIIVLLYTIIVYYPVDINVVNSNAVESTMADVLIS